MSKKMVKKLKFKTNSNNLEYKIEGIYNKVVYAKKL